MNPPPPILDTPGSVTVDSEGGRQSGIDSIAAGFEDSRHRRPRSTQNHN